MDILVHNFFPLFPQPIYGISSEFSPEHRETSLTPVFTKNSSISGHRLEIPEAKINSENYEVIEDMSCMKNKDFSNCTCF